MTQEVLRDLAALCKMLLSLTELCIMVLGALCQELGTETKYIFLIMSQDVYHHSLSNYFAFMKVHCDIKNKDLTFHILAE